MSSKKTNFGTCLILMPGRKEEKQSKQGACREMSRRWTALDRSFIIRDQIIRRRVIGLWYSISSESQGGCLRDFHTLNRMKAPSLPHTSPTHRVSSKREKTKLLIAERASKRNSDTVSICTVLGICCAYLYRRERQIFLCADSSDGSAFVVGSSQITSVCSSYNDLHPTFAKLDLAFPKEVALSYKMRKPEKYSVQNCWSCWHTLSTFDLIVQMTIAMSAG